MNKRAAAKGRLYADLKTEDLLDLPPDERMKAILKMSPEGQACDRSLPQERQARRVHGGHEAAAARNSDGAEQSSTGCNQ